MKKIRFQMVRGELTRTIVKDFTEDLRRCLYAISGQNTPPDSLTEAEISFLADSSHLSFFDSGKAAEFADKYNFVQVGMANYDELETLVGKLLIPRSYIDDSPRLIIASRYFFAKINGIAMSKGYTSQIEQYDETYLKFLQALHSQYNDFASLNAETYNVVQKEMRERSRSKEKLKRIVKIGSKVGYGICLE